MTRAIRSICLLAGGVMALSLHDARAAMIISVTPSGPGGTATITSIDNTFAVPTAYFTANLTSLAPIDFTFTVSSPGLYDLSFDRANITNGTSTAIQALRFTLLSAPSGSDLSQVQNNITLPLPNPSFPVLGTSVQLNGPPNLNPGAVTSIGAVPRIGGGSGQQTFVLELTPLSPAPEPASIVMAGAGILAFVGYELRRRRAGDHPTPA